MGLSAPLGHTSLVPPFPTPLRWGSRWVRFSKEYGSGHRPVHIGVAGDLTGANGPEPEPQSIRVTHASGRRNGMISAGPSSAVGRAVVSECLSRRCRLPFAPGDGDWRLPKPVRSA